MALWFFLSYAHSDEALRDKEHVENFFRDLSLEVSSKTGHSVSECGYLDSFDLKTGDPWKTELSNAVRTSRTFVCLMNARYFRRPYCGKEWQLFENRCNQFEMQTGQTTKLILPVLWDKPEEGEFPEFAMDLQFGISLDGVSEADRDTIEDFNQKGMRYVIKRRSTTHHNAYESCIESLAETIIHRANEFTLPELAEQDLPTIDQIQPKFPIENVGVTATTITEGASSIQANFAVVAATQTEIQPLLGISPAAYGLGSQQWIPFYPESAQRFFLIAQAQASENELMVEWLNVDGNLVQRLEEAEERKAIVIMVVDPMTARLQQYARILEDFDRFTFRNCVVLIPWVNNKTDGDEAMDALERVLRRRFAMSNPCYLRNDINSIEQLEREISGAIKDVGEILAAERKPQRELAKGRFETPPSLNAV